MPYDEEADRRIKKAVKNWKQVDAKKMFGGVCYLLNGNMFCGVYKDYLILRLGEKIAADAMSGAQVMPFDITGRPMKGWVMVAPEGFKNDEQLKIWLNKAKDFAAELPPKQKK